MCGQLRSFLGRYALPSVSEFCSTVTSTRFQSTTVFPKPRSDIFGSDNVVSSPLPDIQMPTEDIFSFIMKEFPNYGSKIGLVDGLSGREYSYNEIAEITRKFSSGLQNRLGFEKGDVLGIVAPNSPEYAVLYLGTLAAGGVVSTCNPAYTADELAYQFKNSSTKIIATIPAILPTIQEAAEKSGVEKIIVLDESKQNSSTGNLISYSSLVADSGSLLDPVRTEPDDVMVLPYSSGTTGLPKGVMLTNRSISSNVLQKIHPELMSLKADDSRLLGILPFFHIYGMVSTLLSSLHAGTRLITLPKFEPETFLSTIEKHRITFAHIVPPLVVFLAKHPLVEKYNVTSIEDLITAAAPLGGDVLKSASERTRCKLIRQAYGLTEASPITHMMAKSLGMSSPASIGACIRSMKVKIVDPESGEVLPANKEGEMWIYGPNVMKGYLNNPEATQKSITHDGWFKSGDIGIVESLNQKAKSLTLTLQSGRPPKHVIF